MRDSAENSSLFSCAVVSHDSWVTIDEPTSTFQDRFFGSFQIPVDSFSEPLAVIGWRSKP